MARTPRYLFGRNKSAALEAVLSGTAPGGGGGGGGSGAPAAPLGPFADFDSLLAHDTSGFVGGELALAPDMEQGFPRLWMWGYAGWAAIEREVQSLFVWHRMSGAAMFELARRVLRPRMGYALAEEQIFVEDTWAVNDTLKLEFLPMNIPAFQGDEQGYTGGEPLHVRHSNGKTALIMPEFTMSSGATVQVPASFSPMTAGEITAVADTFAIANVGGVNCLKVLAAGRVAIWGRLTAGVQDNWSRLV